MSDNSRVSIFDKLIRANDVAIGLGISIRTIYNWAHTPQKYKTPKDLFVKHGNRLYVDKGVLENWVLSKQRK